MPLNRIDVDAAVTALELAGAEVERKGNTLAIRHEIVGLVKVLYIENETVYQPGYNRVLNKLIHH